MKINYRMWLAAALIVTSSFAMSATALAGHCCGKGGRIYNENDGKFYNLPSKSCCTVYRSVDNRYIPVKKMSCNWGHKGCHGMKKSCHTMIGVSCQVRPAHWWNTTWMPASNECWYVR